ncbi:hypothetical protein [Streptomyces sp. DT203]|uniref:hypothetical protein n=1 Tax=Streptomyces sp. DT203 TaxID=3393424 RepID=UPI003CF3367A
MPFVGLAQFFRREISGFACGPDGADLVQLFRCPFTHGPYLERRYRLRWRRARQTEHAERFLADPPHVPLPGTAVFFLNGLTLSTYIVRLGSLKGKHHLSDAQLGLIGMAFAVAALACMQEVGPLTARVRQ